MQLRQSCPICGGDVIPSPRYPLYLCASCAARASDRDGHLLSFANASLSGGFIARYTHSGAPYSSHDCYVDGVACRADEARFGGIVIQANEALERGRH
jgi:hypothetical protein